MSRAGGKRFEAQVGTVYRNKNGMSFRCEASWRNTFDERRWNSPPRWDARLVNVKSGWCFAAHGLVQYPDGTIEWDYSSGGYFQEVAG